ncbi:MAG TPA: TonB-dependent receptor [Flavipsychrobacter sp.]|nr:TonB-dependent receptor [Flavipsychrobacter sp.]
MLTRKYLLLVALLFASRISFAQPFNVSGTILDETDNSFLIGVSVVLSPVNDTAQKFGSVTDVDGLFSIQNLPAGQYRLKASYIGFQNLERTVNVNQNLELGTLKMKVLSTQLQNVTVTGQQIRATQSGDTTSFNAGAFKTNPDASAEDLINKMPGISTEGGTVKANGEDVKQILVDGKPFFGDDPNAAIKNLPAEIIDRIQVFDRLSDQAQLTGFNDGNEQRTINIITKPGRNTGQFGKIFGGYGARDFKFKDNLYLGGGNVNFFKGDTRVSIIALSNNVNQQNFSSDDLMGVVGQSSGQNRGGSSRGGSSRGGRGSSGGRSSDGGSRGGGSNAGNFLIGQQPGITTTHSVGINYSDEWAKGMKVSGSYFFNNTTNENTNSLTRNYFGGLDSNLIYKESSATTSKNTNHRANLRIEYDIDSSNSIIFSPRISYQHNEFTRNLLGESRYSDSTLLNSTNNTNTSNNDGYNLGANLTYRHKFAKRGRTFSINLNSSVNNRIGDGTTYSLNRYANIDSNTIDTNLLDQHFDLNSNTQNYSANLTYTEPLNERSQLMINYNPSVSKSKSDREVMNRNGNEYNDHEPELSNKFENTYNTQRGGLTYQLRDEKVMFTAGFNYQQAMLRGIQFYPRSFEVDRSFSNVLPSATFNYKFSRTKNLRIMYRTNTNPPSINQLQNVLDITNPLIVRTGNANLEQDYTHSLTFRYGNTNTTTSRNFFAMLYGSYVKDYIGNETIFPTGTIAFGESLVLTQGSQITRPVNLDGYFTARSFLTYGMPVGAIKSNVNLNLGVNYNRQPGRIRYAADSNELFNGTEGISNIANNYTLSGGAVVSSNISENFDFTIGYSGNYTIVRNSAQSQSNNNFYNHNASLRLNYIHKDRIVVNTTANQMLFAGLSQGFNQSFLLWNAAVGYKFLPDKSLDVRLSVYDILNQNRAIERTVTETFIEDSYTNVLRRYFMLHATYTLRRFGGVNANATGSNNTSDVVEPAGERRERRNQP